MLMVKVKICGLKRYEDIAYVNELMPDYVGFIFANSKRYVGIEEAKNLIGILDKKIQRVGVFVNENIEKVKYIAEYLNLHIIQLHGNEDEIYIKKLKGFRTWKVLGIDIRENIIDKLKHYQKQIDILNNLPIEAIVLDSKLKNIQGGLGKSFNLEVVNMLEIKKPIILAGGLNCNNITNAISKVRPFAVDVSSGVEKDGIKDFDKMNEFIKKVRDFE